MCAKKSIKNSVNSVKKGAEKRAQDNEGLSYNTDTAEGEAAVASQTIKTTKVKGTEETEEITVETQTYKTAKYSEAEETENGTAGITAVETTKTESTGETAAAVELNITAIGTEAANDSGNVDAVESCAESVEDISELEPPTNPTEGMIGALSIGGWHGILNVIRHRAVRPKFGFKGGKRHTFKTAIKYIIPVIAIVLLVVIVLLFVPFRGGILVDALNPGGAGTSPGGNLEQGTDGGFGLSSTPNIVVTPSPIRTPAPTPTPDPRVVRYLTVDEIDAFMERNDYESKNQEALVDAAVSLVGRVRYFWGGKSMAVGDDPEWGKLHWVVSEGDETSGTQQPFGLDCSGYVNWCFIQLHKRLGLTPKEVLNLVGDGTWNQWNNSDPVEKNEIRIGDLAFINSYPSRDGNHVGICVGFDVNGEPLIAQCSSSQNNVVVSTCGIYFKYFRRPPVELV